MKVLDTIMARVRRWTGRWRVARIPRSLFAPAYDQVTRRMSSWAARWDLGPLERYLGGHASYRKARETLRGSMGGRRILFFVGHGSFSALLTAPRLGRKGAGEGAGTHGYLLDVSDLGAVRNLHCTAWACRSGKNLGEELGSRAGGAFLGFKDDIAMTINHAPSEQLWESAIVQTFRAVAQNGGISREHGEMLRNVLTNLRREIKSGRRDTGLHDPFNAMFLKRAARLVTCYVREE